jgi:hypothetical protein
MVGLFSPKASVLNETLYWIRRIRTVTEYWSRCLATEMILAGIRVIFNLSAFDLYGNE